MEIGRDISTCALWRLLCMQLAVLAAQNRSADCFEQTRPWRSRSLAQCLPLWLYLIQAITRHTCSCIEPRAYRITHNKSVNTMFAHSPPHEPSRSWDSVQKNSIHFVSLALIQFHSFHFIFTVCLCVESVKSVKNNCRMLWSIPKHQHLIEL